MSYQEVMEEVDGDGKIAEIFMKNPVQQQVLMCPNCAKTINPLSPYVVVKCKYCNHDFKTSPNPDIYSTYAKGFLKKLKHKNALILLMDSKWAEDVLEDIAEDFKIMHNTSLMMVKVDGPFKEYKIDRNKCNNCGVCHSCLKCLSCGNVFSQDNMCPECSSKKITKYYFDKVKYDKKKKKFLCPECNNENIKFTVFEGNLKKCPSCKSEKIIYGNRKLYHILIIRRYGGSLIK